MIRAARTSHVRGYGGRIREVTAITPHVRAPDQCGAGCRPVPMAPVAPTLVGCVSSTTSSRSYDLTYDDVFMVPSRSAVRLRLDVDLVVRRRHGHHHPARRRQHDRDRRPPDGRDHRPPRRPRRHPAGHPDRRRHRRRRLGQVAPPRLRHPDHARPRPDRRRRARRCCPSGPTARASSSTDDRPVGVVTEADLTGVDRFTQLSEVMSTDLVLLDADIDPREAFDTLDARAAAGSPRSSTPTAGSSASSPARAPCARTLYTPALDADGRLRIAAAVGINGDVAGKAKQLLDAGVDMLVVDTAHGHQESMIERAAARSARSTRRCPIVAGNVVTAEGVRDLIEAGADIVKVGVGPGAMCTTRMMTGVGRPQFSAVLECAAEAQRARQARLGRRRRPAPARRRAGAGRRRVQRHDRLVVRRHLRVARRPATRRRRAPVQGVLRHGVGARGAQPHASEDRPTTGPARRCSRRASPPRGCTSTRPARASRT